MENTWAAPGVDCICVKPQWVGRRLVESTFLGIRAFTIEDYIKDPAPKFMVQYRISSVSVLDTDDEGHRVKLYFKEFEGPWCVCGFRPLEPVEVEERKRTTAPVDLEKV